jgi:hypothetical protein
MPPRPNGSGFRSRPAWCCLTNAASPCAPVIRVFELAVNISQAWGPEGQADSYKARTLRYSSYNLADNLLHQRLPKAI